MKRTRLWPCLAALVLACAQLASADSVWPAGWLDGTRDADDPLLQASNVDPGYAKAIREFGRLEDHLERARKEKRPLLFYYLYTPG